MTGWVKLHRKITQWEWYKNNNTKAVMLHFILTANIKPVKYMGMTVPRGSLILKVESRKYPETSLCAQLGMTQREVRTAMNHLILTEEITKKSTNKFTVITVNKYCLYQGNGGENGLSTDIPADFKGRPKANQRTDIEEYKKEACKNTDKTIRDSLNSLHFTAELNTAVKKWVNYKKEKNQEYKKEGIAILLSQIEEKALQYGDLKVSELIYVCMGNNWAGIIWALLLEKPFQKKEAKGRFLNFTQREKSDEYWQDIEKMESRLLLERCVKD